MYAQSNRFGMWTDPCFQSKAQRCLCLSIAHYMLKGTLALDQFELIQSLLKGLVAATSGLKRWLCIPTQIYIHYQRQFSGGNPTSTWGDVNYRIYRMKEAARSCEVHRRCSFKKDGEMNLMYVTDLILDLFGDARFQIEIAHFIQYVGCKTLPNSSAAVRGHIIV